MGTDLKLKDLFGETQTEQDISTVSVPKADGTGREFYVKRPVIYYNLVASPPYAPESTEDIPIFWNVGDGPLWGDVPNDKGNCRGGVHAPIAGKTTKPIIYIQVEKYLQGVTADNTGKAELIYLYEPLAGATLLEVRNKTGTADFTAQPGWGQLIQGTDGQTYTYTQLTDLSGIVIGIEQPNKIIDQRLFYSFLMEKTNSAVAYTATENGDYTIVPPAESSGISAVSLTVNVAGGGSDDYYLLKNPLGGMPIYPNSSKTFLHTDEVIASSFKPYIYSIGNSNANEAYGIPVATMVNFHFKEPTADSYANSILFINSASAATLSQYILKLFLGSSWTFGDMTLAVGWNVCTFIVDDSGTTTAATCTATTIDAINMTLQGYGGIPKNNFDWAAMDAYTLSFFKDAAVTAGASVDFSINIGDVLNTIYFNTIHDTTKLDTCLETANYPYSAELAGITMPWNNALVYTLGTSSLYVHIGDLSSMQPGTYIIYVMQSEMPTVLYSTKALDASAVIPGMVISKGWSAKSFPIGAEVTVSDILNDLLLIKDNYFAKSPQTYG